jgi:hypothetical protein
LINRLLHHLATICPRTCGPSIHEAQIRSGATYIKVCALGCKVPKSLKRMAQKGTFRMLDRQDRIPAWPEAEPSNRALGQLGKSKDGEVRTANVTPEERSESARKAAKARWEKKRRQQSS